MEEDIQDMMKYTWDSYHIEKNEVVIQYATLENDFTVHSHDFTELVIILGGEGSHIIQDKEYALRKGDVYVIAGDTSHGYKTEHSLRLINILFRPDGILLDGIRKELNGYRAMFEIEPLYRIENDFKAKLNLDILQLSEVTKITDEILLRSKSQTMENRILIQTLINLLIARLSSFYNDKMEHKPQQMLRLSSIIDYLEKNLSDSLDVTALARQANYSPRHFNRLFQSVFSMTAKQYIMNKRLLYACELLCKNELTITELSSKCGFSDSSYFSRIFYNKFKLTPKEYRKKSSSD